MDNVLERLIIKYPALQYFNISEEISEAELTIVGK